MFRPRLSLSALALLFTLVLVVGCGQTSSATLTPAATPIANLAGSTSGLAGSTSAPAAADPFAPVVQIVKQAQPSVVTVPTDQGLGSGIIYTADGMIVTNNHVVA